MKIGTPQLMTGAAVALGLFAVWFVFRGPGKASMTPTATERRQVEANTWFKGLTAQQTAIYNQAIGETERELRALGIL
ncbi:hypothetical protein [Rubrivivax rivuli]|uniref:Uncharacterized protein n=1 Tax=Rubrivivax rivuli TaxID=1862385 RepID=A0A437RH61_9BURK|nr:hypothetical protein [Rubrivivax rivuli]RVU46103.1 hypothetical protein EOE66_09555 [Rubrivivax rivuli]